jgi:hypothetical protein
VGIWWEKIYTVVLTHLSSVLLSWRIEGHILTDRHKCLMSFPLPSCELFFPWPKLSLNLRLQCSNINVFVFAPWLDIPFHKFAHLRKYTITMTTNFTISPLQSPSSHITSLTHYSPITVAARSEVWNSLLPFVHCDRGFEYHSRHGCLRIFCVCVVLCRYRPCVRLISRPRSSTDCLRLRD